MEWKSKKDGKHFPIGDGRPEDVPSIDDEIARIMASELKTIGFEGMPVDEANVFMENKGSRYLGTVSTNGAEFHEWYSDFDGKYTWAVVDESGKVIAFGGESKSGMLEANSGTASEASLDQPVEPEQEVVVVEEPSSEKIDYVETAVPDSAIEGPSFVDSRDKKFMKDREKERQ